MKRRIMSSDSDIDLKSLLIDDLRVLTTTATARTFDEGIAQLKSSVYNVLYLDHDLGDEDPDKTGYGIVAWLEKNPSSRPHDIFLVTSNPVGRQNMVAALLNMGYFQRSPRHLTLQAQ